VNFVAGMLMTKEGILDALLHELLVEGWTSPHAAIPEDAARKRHLLRTLMNMRPPGRLLGTDFYRNRSPVIADSFRPDRHIDIKGAFRATEVISRCATLNVGDP